MVKVFTTNKNNKIEFTKEELDKLLNEVWNDGYYSNHNNYYYWWTSPHYVYTSPTTATSLSNTALKQNYCTTGETGVKIKINGE